MCGEEARDEKVNEDLGDRDPPKIGGGEVRIRVLYF